MRGLYIYVIAVLSAVLAPLLLTVLQPVKLVVYEQYAGESESGMPLKDFFHVCDMGTFNFIKLSIQVLSTLIAIFATTETFEIAAPFAEGRWMYNFL